VQRDVIEGKVSLAAARDDYGVVLVPGESAGSSCTLDEQATASLRAKLQGPRRKDRPIIDRGDGYEKMLRGEVVPWTRSP
jgi:N-methylhydantoinase B